MCDCIEETNETLREGRTVKAGLHPDGDVRVGVPVEGADLDAELFLWASYCPFCGEAYGEESSNQSNQ